MIPQEQIQEPVVIQIRETGSGEPPSLSPAICENLSVGLR